MLGIGVSKVNGHKFCDQEGEPRDIRIQLITAQCSTGHNKGAEQSAAEVERKDRLRLSSEVRAASWRSDI